MAETWHSFDFILHCRGHSLSYYVELNAKADALCITEGGPITYQQYVRNQSLCMALATAARNVSGEYPCHKDGYVVLYLNVLGNQSLIRRLGQIHAGVRETRL